MHFYDDGLFIGQFGIPGTDDKGENAGKTISKPLCRNATSPHCKR